MLSIILHDTCIHHSNVCDIDIYILMYSVIKFIHAMSLYCIFIELMEYYD